MNKKIIYKCPKCKAWGDINPTKDILTCPQCGIKYKKGDVQAEYITDIKSHDKNIIWG